MYMDRVKLLYQARAAIQENNFDLRLQSYRAFLPDYFFYNLQNYARYGSFYVELMSCAEQVYPGLKDELFISIQAEDRYPHRTAMDQREEQTFNREAKVAGGIHNASDPWST